jgi:PAS domain S-box-containing protein
MEERVDEVQQLRGCINDLVSLLALPAMWSGHKPVQIIETLLDTLVGILRLDFIYARLHDEATAQPIETVRLAQYQPALQPKEVGQALASWLTSDPFTLPLTVPNPIGGGKVNLTRFSLGLQEEGGLVIAGSGRLDFPTETETLLLRVATNQAAIALQSAQGTSQRQQAEGSLREQTEVVEAINRIGQTLSAELDLHKLVQALTDAATELTGAKFGSFFYNVADACGESYMLYTLSGVPLEAFAHFPMPRNTDIFGPTFRGEGVIRLVDVKQDPRYGRSSPYYGMPAGHLPVTSYLAVPVISRSGEVLGGLFFGHPEAGVFTERHERIIVGLAAQAAIAMDNARLFTLAQRERAEAQMAQKQLANILESITDSFIAFDKDWRFTYLNGEAEKLLLRLQLSDKEMLGKRLWETFPDLLESVVYKQFQHAATEQVPVEWEMVYPPLNSWFHIRAYPVNEGLAVYAQDITERKQAEQARAHLAAIVESSDDAIISKNLQGIIRSWNKGAEKIFGYTAAEAIGKSVTILIPEPHIDEEPRILERIRGGETIDHYETVRRRKDGTLIDISLTVSPMRDEDGTIIGASKIARDITERKRAEETLRQSEERYRSLTSILTSVIWTTDAEGGFVAPQPEWEAFTGQTWEEYKDWGRINAFHPDDRLRIQALWQAAVESCSTYELQGRLWHKPSGKYHYCVARAVPLFDTDGAIREWIGNTLDVHGQKEAEEEREQLLIAERVARSAADAASRAKDEFLATVSHELRSPLNAMLGWARILSSKNLDDETAVRGLKAIEQNAKAQAQLIEDLLDVSRIISGKFRLNNEPVEVAGVIEAAVDSVRPTAEVKGVRLQVTLDPDAGPVSGDASRLQQVVWNLLSNAVKFTPREGRVQVRLLRVNSHIEIEVSDTGQGISPEFLPYVFDRFQQADGSSTRTHGGLGLGLAIVRHIVELHGGSVAAASLGKAQGATFTVRLPLMVFHSKLRREERVHPRVDDDEALSFTPSQSLVGVKVLAVDDEQDSLLLLSTVLTQCGARVKTASSAEEGFREVQTWRPDIIVSDIGMPGEDGYTFMKRVKSWAREHGIWIPAVSLTAFARAEDRMKALASGYQIHVPKPVEPAELIAVLVSLIERS